MKLYKYIYYRLLKWAKRRDKIEVAKHTAFVTLTFLVYINLLSILLGLKAYFNFAIEMILGEVQKWHYLLLLIILSLPQYFILLYKKKYLDIIEEFKDETQKEKKRSNIITILYIIASLFVFFFTMYILMLKNQGKL